MATQLYLYAPFRQAFVGQTVWLHNFRRAGFVIDWGDGSPQVAVNAEYLTHAYSAPGKYTVTVGGEAIWGDDQDNAIVASLSGGSEFAYFLLQSGEGTLQGVFDIVEPVTYSKTALNNEFLDLQLPNSDISVGSNEFAVADNLNHALTQLYDNITWLQEQTIVIDPTVNTEFVAWLSAGAVDNVWHATIQGLDTSFNDLTGTTRFDDIIDIKCRKFGPGSYLYIMQATKFSVLNGGSYNATTLVESSAIGFNEPYTDLRAFDVDEFGNVFMIDGSMIYHARYDNIGTRMQLVDRIGGIGNTGDRYLFSNPTDLAVDNQSRIYVVDSGNACVKVFSNSFVWIDTIISPHFAPDDLPIKVCTDQLSGNIFVLTEKRNLVVFNPEFEFIQANNLAANANSVNLIEIIQTQDIHKIFADVLSNYLYVVTDSAVIKITAAGRLISQIEHPTGSAFTNLRGGCIDDHNQIYVAKNDRIYQYVDPSAAVRLGRNYSGEFPLSAITVHESGHELVQDWVYNKSLKRLIHNVVLLNGSIRKKIVIAFDLDGSIRSFFVRSIESDEKFSVEIDLNNYVGVNEYVLSDVVNRTLSGVLAFQQGILNTLKPITSFVPTAFPYPVLPE